MKAWVSYYKRVTRIKPLALPWYQKDYWRKALKSCHQYWQSSSINPFRLELCPMTGKVTMCQQSSRSRVLVPCELPPNFSDLYLLQDIGTCHRQQRLKHLDCYKILTDCQHGSHSRRSWEIQLVTLCHDILVSKLKIPRQSSYVVLVT